MFLNFEDIVVSNTTEEDRIEQILGIIMAQKYSLKVGLNRFFEKREHDFSSELMQLHDTEMLSPIDTSKIYKKYREDALPSLFFLK